MDVALVGYIHFSFPSYVVTLFSLSNCTSRYIIAREFLHNLSVIKLHITLTILGNTYIMPIRRKRLCLPKCI